jgi:hypothetical protein
MVFHVHSLSRRLIEPDSGRIPRILPLDKRANIGVVVSQD